MMKLRPIVLLVCLSCLPHRVVAAPSAEVDKPKVAAFLLASSGIAPKLRARIVRRLGKALRRNSRLDAKDSDKLLAEFSGDIPSQKIAEVSADHDAAVKLLIAGKARQALTKLEEVIGRYETLLAFIRKRRFAHAYVALGVAHATLGKSRQASRVFSRLFAWRPRAVYPPLFDTKFLPLFERAQKKTRKAKRGSIELVTQPPGARAYVDGRFVGATPTVAFGLTVGRHYATFKKAGHVKGGLVVSVDPGRQRSFSAELKQSQKFLILQESLKGATAALGQEQANSAMTDLRVVLFLDQVVFAKVERTAGGLQLNAYLYDLRSKLRLNHARMTFDPNKPDSIDELARLVYVNVPYDGRIPAPPEPPPPPPVTRRAFYAKWWFWTAIAAGAAAVATTIVLIPRSEECPGGNRCVFVQH